jgi:putative transposase
VPCSAGMTQIARNITDMNGGFLHRKYHLILDRDAKFSDEFRHVLAREGLHVIRLPPRSPNLNSFADRFVRPIKEGCLNRMTFFGTASLRHAIEQYIPHYHCERNHLGLGKLVAAAGCRHWRT